MTWLRCYTVSCLIGVATFAFELGLIVGRWWP